MAEIADSSCMVNFLREGRATPQASNQAGAALFSHAETSADDGTSAMPLSHSIGVDHEVITRAQLALQAMHDAAERYALEKVLITPVPRTSSLDGFGGVDHDLINRAQASLKMLENETALAHRNADLQSEAAIDDALVSRVQRSLQGLCAEAGRLEETLRIEPGSEPDEQFLPSDQLKHWNDPRGLKEYSETLAPVHSPSRVAAREVCADMVELCHLLKQRIPEPRQAWWTTAMTRCRTMRRAMRCQMSWYISLILAIFALLPLLLLPQDDVHMTAAYFPAISTHTLSSLQPEAYTWSLFLQSSAECNSALLPKVRDSTLTGPHSRSQHHAFKGQPHQKMRHGPSSLRNIASRLPQLLF